MWQSFVDVIRLGIFSAAHVCAGSLGGGIVAVSVVVRLALLPLTLRAARQMRANQAKLLKLKPQIDALQRRHASDPVKLFAETQALQQQAGVKVFTSGSALGMLLQMPLLGGVFAAVRSGLGANVRFLWIANLARPDVTLLLAVTAASAAVASATPAAPSAGGPPPTLMLGITVVATLAFLWSASSAVVLSVGAGTLVSALQNWLLARDREVAA